MSESPKPADALRTLPERAFRARARLVAGVFCLGCCGLAVMEDIGRGCVDRHCSRICNRICLLLSYM